MSGIARSGRLEGKTAIITGGGRGLGKATALAFAREGADVVVAARTSSELLKTADEIRALGRRSLAVVTDVSKTADLERLAKASLEFLGHVDILMNNAGGSSTAGSVTQLSEENWDMTFATNLKSAYTLSKLILPHMIERGYGNIINVSSTRGIGARPEAVAYCCAKAGVIMLTKCMALDYIKHGIRVNCIGPGAIETERWELTNEALLHPERVDEIAMGIPEDTRDQFKARVLALRNNPDGVKKVVGGSNPLNTRGSREDIAMTAVFLASDEAPFVNGITVMVDGATTVR